MDSAILFAGDVQLGNKTRAGNRIARVHYENHARQLAGRVPGLRVLKIESHSETLQQALECANHLAEHGTLPPTSADVMHSTLLDALASYSMTVVQRSSTSASSGNVDSLVATRALADAHSTLFRNPRRRHCSVPFPFTHTELGKYIVDEIDWRTRHRQNEGYVDCSARIPSDRKPTAPRHCNYYGIRTLYSITCAASRPSLLSGSLFGMVIVMVISGRNTSLSSSSCSH